MASRFPAGFAPDVVEAKPLRGYKLWLKFRDGNEGVADMSDFSPKTPGSSLWRSMREFRRGEAKHDTVSWPRDDGGTIDFCPFSLYVRAGLATWEELNDPGDAKETPRAIDLSDRRGDTFWVKMDTGNAGFVKPERDLNGDMDAFTMPDRHSGTSFITDSGDIVWKNEFWIEAEDVDAVLSAKRNGKAI